ncbi:FecR family protein [Rhizosphaericola mali]|uniref:FecR family protein n=1 Tax=Rhizosphaericola mali TaxID=2545455 RepID=A0A5P2G6A7_9BACT|nr:FecR family protein [Rhizosphaericola mali]QES90228.1 FecR family protein [Rhizosphaericola mali]
MTKQEVELLLKKYRLGLCSDEEKKIIEDWYQKEYNASNFLWDKQDKEKFKQLLDSSIFPDIDERNAIKVHRRPVYQYFTAAAAITGLIVGCIFLWRNHNENKKDWNLESQAVRYQNDVDPGKAGATWIINNDKSYTLEGNTDMIKNGSNNLGKQNNNELIIDSAFANRNTSFENTISTGNAQQYKVVLTDGTKIWINAASSIHFKMPFDKNKREIFLSGEAYFEVAHNDEKPFFVISDKDTISVLGTHFNINAYNDEPNYVATLLEGKIKYSTAYIHNSNPYILSPNEQIIRKEHSALIEPTDDAENKTAWKDGFFSFSNDDIHTVMRQLARWYNIQVDYENTNYKEKFYGDLRKDAPLSSILSVLEKSGVKFLIQGTKVTVL